LAEGGFIFKDKRLDEMLFRYRARNWPQSLDKEEQGRWQEQRMARLTESGAGASITLAEYRQRLDELRQQQPNRAPLWDALEHWPIEIGLRDE
jgi:exodeoxyribonuclease-1